MYKSSFNMGRTSFRTTRKDKPIVILFRFRRIDFPIDLPHYISDYIFLIIVWGKVLFKTGHTPDTNADDGG